RRPEDRGEGVLVSGRGGAGWTDSPFDGPGVHIQPVHPAGEVADDHSAVGHQGASGDLDGVECGPDVEGGLPEQLAVAVESVDVTGRVGGVHAVVNHGRGTGDRACLVSPLHLEVADGLWAEAVLGEVIPSALRVVVVHGPVVRVARDDIDTAEEATR